MDPFSLENLMFDEKPTNWLKTIANLVSSELKETGEKQECNFCKFEIISHQSIDDFWLEYVFNREHCRMHRRNSEESIRWLNSIIFNSKYVNYLKPITTEVPFIKK